MFVCFFICACFCCGCCDSWSSYFGLRVFCFVLDGLVGVRIFGFIFIFLRLGVFLFICRCLCVGRECWCMVVCMLRVMYV